MVLRAHIPLIFLRSGGVVGSDCSPKTLPLRYRPPPRENLSNRSPGTLQSSGSHGFPLHTVLWTSSPVKAVISIRGANRAMRSRRRADVGCCSVVVVGEQGVLGSTSSLMAIEARGEGRFPGEVTGEREGGEGKGEGSSGVGGSLSSEVVVVVGETDPDAGAATGDAVSALVDGCIWGVPGKLGSGEDM
ncbi:uncharacterized protein EV422DRAFT_518675 [Fimicolochytrium jonesii]|uniref:uncharacterized protein n=1 Tax=Fimicolochytrium jonesii TaxID=1396493 RepID=UPI0022FF23ED|nr:uncharacterized protein EV422DRAFT_518675 [Fimicolochytrium jonesii]KAI8824032.1 hypothetical protein EV422DRAFT_518675 [Fimicolochytrium jonesii]